MLDAGVYCVEPVRIPGVASKRHNIISLTVARKFRFAPLEERGGAFLEISALEAFTIELFTECGVAVIAFLHLADYTFEGAYGVLGGG